jgi:large subunit ribosomal protein L31
VVACLQLVVPRSLGQKVALNRGISVSIESDQIVRRQALKEKIHPNYAESKVACACGETFTTRSTIKAIRVDICSKCHPFFTGKQKLLDAEGRVEKFQKKYAKK